MKMIASYFILCWFGMVFSLECTGGVPVILQTTPNQISHFKKMSIPGAMPVVWQTTPNQISHFRKMSMPEHKPTQLETNHTQVTQKLTNSSKPVTQIGSKATQDFIRTNVSAASSGYKKGPIWNVHIPAVSEEKENGINTNSDEIITDSQKPTAPGWARIAFKNDADQVFQYFLSSPSAEGEGEKKKTDLLRTENFNNQVALPVSHTSSAASQVVYGRENGSVAVYVNIHSKGHTLVCGTEQTKDAPLERSLFQWTQSNGKDVQVSDLVSILPSGKLVFNQFLADKSGLYKCSASYKLGGFKYKKKYSFLVYGFHRPDESLTVRADFFSKGCNENANSNVAKFLLAKLQSYLRNLSCEIKERVVSCDWFSRNQDIKPDPNRVKVHMEFFVLPYGILWEQHCPPGDSNEKDCDKETHNQMIKASSVLQDFFQEHKEFDSGISGLDKMKLLDESLRTVTISHCKPGFGKDSTQHDCPNCCESMNFKPFVITIGILSAAVVVLIFTIIGLCFRFVCLPQLSYQPVNKEETFLPEIHVPEH
ncbi:uncharacterized protein LOC127529131 isoform X2 [Erpetoichthys calabaricus]|uniref:uncharacterized protein LOC127529131 isoform X2 n=1 Tax=Erpetoichthys calabaricus TaxID=27687 RepID=UPI002234C1A6|nr:uncharacterized protein LOC127529131 isoform X2 [Erpetoichthys calabaricus]